MQKQTGILLKNYSPKKQKVSLFDKTLGRIEAIYTSTQNNCPLHHGALLTYFIQPTSHLYSISNIEVQSIPFTLAQHDIYFLHHILDLCYYLLPLNIAYPTIFSLLEAAFDQLIDNKPIILLRFFSSLGVYSENLPFEKNYFHRLLSYPFETILKEKFDETQLKMLELWLIRSKEMHPYSKQLKTNYLITRCSYEKK